MAHSPAPGQSEENKRILKELEDQKRQIKMKTQHTNFPSGVLLTTLNKFKSPDDLQLV